MCAMRIIKPADSLTVANLVMTLYGAPGSLKTALLSTAEAAVLLDFDRTAHRAPLRLADVVQLDSWADATSLDRAFFEPYKTIGIDTIGRLAELVGRDLMEKDPKMGYNGALSLQGYGRLGAAFNGWFQTLKSFGKDIVIISHVSEEMKGDEIIERLDTPGKMIKSEVYKVSDCMGRLAMRKGKLTLMFSPSDTSYGKNPAQFEPIVVPPLADTPRFLADLIAKTKTSINKLTEEQQQMTLVLTEWAAEVKRATSAEGMTKLIGAAGLLPANAQKAAKAALHKAATEVGFEFKGGKYVEAAS